jgi:phosphoribosylformylglycinamidine synthase subunit PurQ / glutaminase
MKVAVLQFPGSNCDQDCVHVMRSVMGASVELVWHKSSELGGVDAVLVPGGFSYGDYLRSGAIARFSPVMGAVKAFAEQGGLVLGICNGFQILCEAGLLPGAMVRNRSMEFVCSPVLIQTQTTNSPFTRLTPLDRPARIPVAHMDGCYVAEPQELEALKKNDQILWKYVDNSGSASESGNPNGSIENIAGVSNAQGNVAGLMPHPERACEAVLGMTDGKWIFDSLCASIRDGFKKSI